MNLPPMPLDRARALGAALGMDASAASALLNGILMPEWDVLLKLCAFTQCQPGFFLDDSPSQYPPETRIVKPLGSGENIVIRMPPQSAPNWGAADADWTYLQAKKPMGFGVVAGDFVVNYIPPEGDIAIRKDSLYLLGVDSHFEIRKCGEVQKGCVALLASDTQDASEIPRLLPLVSNDYDTITEEAVAKSGIHHFGVITGAIRPAQVMRAC